MVALTTCCDSILTCFQPLRGFDGGIEGCVCASASTPLFVVLQFQNAFQNDLWLLFDTVSNLTLHSNGARCVLFWNPTLGIVERQNTFDGEPFGVLPIGRLRSPF